MFTAQSVVVLIKRTEMEATPKIAYMHEIPVLEALHGQNRIVLVEGESPLGKVELDEELEMQRMLTEYTKREEEEHPVLQVYKNLAAFERAVDTVSTAVVKRGRKAADTDSE